MTDAPTAALLSQLEETRDRVPAADLPEVIGRLAGLQAALLARLVTPSAPVARIGASAASPTPDRLLTANEATTRLGRSLDWLYENAPRLPFAFRLGRNWKFNEAGMVMWTQGGRK